MEIYLVSKIVDGKQEWVELYDTNEDAVAACQKQLDEIGQPIPEGTQVTVFERTLHQSVAETTVTVQVDAEELIAEVNKAREKLEERMDRLKQMSGHVKILLSTNYNNFEFSLPIHAGMSVAEMNGVRKTVQRLCDEAVRQFRQALKANQQLAMADPDRLEATVKHIRATPQRWWSPEMKGAVKAWDDYCYRRENPYDYDDDPEWLGPDEFNKRMYGNFDGTPSESASTIQAPTGMLEGDEYESPEC